MGEVYRARHVKLGREAAVKVLPSDVSWDPERRHRFEREARAASALNHPSIVTIYDIDEHEGRTFIAMELVDGVTLRKLLSEGPLDTRETLRLASAIAEGLARAHAAGIVHRDLKPDNVMITADGRVKILDFGLAKQIPSAVEVGSDLTTMSRTTQAGMVLGTVPYMSPEQASGRPVDRLSDQFSFGVVLYEMLCGRRPFEGDSVATLLSAILRDAPPPVRSLRPETRREVEEIVLRCLEKNPENRYASFEDVRAALRRSEESLAARSPGLVLGRRASAAVLVLFAVAGVGAAWSWLRDDVVRFLERERLAEVTRLTEAGELFEAWRIARELLPRLPDDPEVRKMVERITIPISIVTEPPGAEVSMKGYASSDDAWIRLGETPLGGARVPYALAHWRIRKTGFETFEGAPFGARPFMAFARGFRLDPAGSRPDEMIRVPGGPYARFRFPPVELEDYWIDRYEVANRAFKEFVDARGYENEAYWTDPFADEGRPLSRVEAMDRFVDRTGRPGPAGWEFAAYDEGEGELPVGGVSWHEAAAYCRSVGKSLPTLFHWSAATAQDQLADIVRHSNFGREGPAPVGSHPGLSDFGAYDMAGNVKEWCWNEGSGGRYILGGSWGEPTYTFRLDADVRPPFSREPSHGFRCALYPAPLDEALQGLLLPSRFAVETKPVEDEIFEAYRRIYTYDPLPLDATVEAIDESSPHWRKETVSFEAAYGDERVLAHLFLPRGAEPPYQPVVWFPGNDVFFLPGGDALASSFLFDFIPRSGRALVYPVYKGTYERHVPFSFAPNEWRDLIILWSKDVSRTVDYLEERPDIDTGKLAYYGFSSGAIYGPIFTAIDDRFRASVLLAGGVVGDFPPEVNAIHFAPRSRVPTLMLNGENDFINPYDVSQKPLFDLLGAPESEKRHARLEGGHIPPDRLELIEEILSWLDRHLGPVGPASSTSRE